MNWTILFLFSLPYFCDIVSTSLTFFQNNKTEVLLIYQKLLLKRKEYLEQEILNLQEKISLLPPGTLVCTKNGKRFKWYHSLNHSYTYLPKSQEILAENLALKNYCQLQLKHLTAERDAINAYLSKSSDFSPGLSFFEHHPEHQRLLSKALQSSFSTLSKELAIWASASYETNPSHPEQLSCTSISGHLLRSKSEVIIDTALCTNKIPFRYECILTLDSKTFFPDFTIRHPENGSFFYWEHFGMMDSPAYSQNAFSKLQIYACHGILPTVNLITTYETKEHPLSAQNVQELITHYFL